MSQLHQLSFPETFSVVLVSIRQILLVVLLFLERLLESSLVLVLGEVILVNSFSFSCDYL